MAAYETAKSDSASLWRNVFPITFALYTTRDFTQHQPARDNAGRTPLSRMFESVHNVTHGVKPTPAPVSATVFLKPKYEEKCRLLLNATAINNYDPPPPPAVRLLALSSILSRFESRPSGPLYMCKLDLTNAYWSIKLPRRRRRTFVVRAGQRRWRFTCLPFGWKYAPAICQRLVAGIVARALRGTHTD